MTSPIANETNPQLPALIDRDGKPMADSRDVAVKFGKEHKAVLRAIRNLLDIDPEARRNFAPWSFTLPETGSREYPCYLMDRDGFALLAMGFTGREAIQWKRQHIEAFNHYESIALAALEEEKRIALAKAEEAASKVKELTPKAAFYDDVKVSQGLLTFDEAAKELGMGRNILMESLRERGVLSKQRDYQGKFSNTPKQQYVARGLFRVVPKVSKPDRSGKTHSYSQTYVTPKGLTRIWEVFGKDRF